MMYNEATYGFPGGGFLVAIDDGYGGVGGYMLAGEGESYGYEEEGYQDEDGPAR